MNEELYELYKEDKDFKQYVDAWCKDHDLSIFEAFCMKGRISNENETINHNTVLQH